MHASKKKQFPSIKTKFKNIHFKKIFQNEKLWGKTA